MTKQVIIVDYGMGNLHSVNKAVLTVGGTPVVTGDGSLIAKAEKLILPGVGAFGDCMANLQKAELVPVLKEYLQSGKPFLGICLGMQVLFEGSEEAPGVQGIGFFKGQVRKLVTKEKIPHMGWNRLTVVNPSPLLTDATGKYVYFVHSYHCEPADKKIITAVCDYGQQITASVGQGFVQGFQFHPEKSSRVGLGMLKKFVEW
jgi:glutamine amidotransferase